MNKYYKNELKNKLQEKMFLRIYGMVPFLFFSACNLRFKTLLKLCS